MFKLFNVTLMKTIKNAIARFQYITIDHPILTHSQQAYMAFKSGCEWVQLRIKEASLSLIENEVELSLKAAHLFQAVLILDDYVEIAKRYGVHGVHLGKHDMPLLQARSILGNDFIIGATANTFDDIIFFNQLPIQYIGLGPFRHTTTKKKLAPILGLEGYQNIIRKCNQENVHLPIIAIGGITYHDLPAIIQLGVHGVAVSSTIAFSPNFEKTISQFVNFFNRMELN